jgi:hypothetical protein
MRTIALALLLAAVSTAALAAPDAPAKPAAAKPAAKTAMFDPRDPAAIVALLAGMDAKAAVTKAGDGLVTMTVTTPGGGFGLQFVSCDAKGKACGGLVFSTAFDRKAPTLSQINVFNRSQFACRGFLSDDGKANVMYPVMLTLRMNAAEVTQHVGVWQGCLGSFGAFLKDPAVFLATS